MLASQGGYTCWMVRLVECDGSLGPLQITWCCRSNHVHFSVDNFQSTFALNISKNHQSGVDVGKTIIILFLILTLVRLIFLLIGLFLSELLDQETTLSSGVFRVNEIPLFIFFGMNMAR